MKNRLLRSFAFTLLIIVATAAPSIADTGVPGTPTRPAANDFAGQIMADGKIGRVGIGTKEPATTLDVYQGEVKIGSTGAACTKGLAGALRSVGNRLQFCGGEGWRNVSLDKAE